MDPLVRQSALEILLQHEKELSAEELKKALHLGLTDPDLNISEIAWNYVNSKGRVGEFKTELEEFIARLKKTGDDYSIGLSRLIQKKI